MVLSISMSAYNIRDTKSDIMSDALYLPEAGVLSEEQQFYLEALTSGTLQGIPLTVDDSSKSLGRAPSKSLYERWASLPLTEGDLLEPFQEIVDVIRKAKLQNPKQTPNLVVDQSAQEHIEAQNFNNPAMLSQYFGYMVNEGLHTRRLEILTDIVVHEIRELISRNGRARVVNFGPGPFPLERNIASKLSKEERMKTQLLAVDASEDLLRYGLARGFIDKAVAVDARIKTAGYFEEHLGEVDIAIFAEILEHIDNVGVVFQKNILPWLRSAKASLIGSVPNAVQLAEVIPMLVGKGSPHQLERPIFDEFSDHHSFFTASSLVSLLTNTWGYDDIGVLSNGVRLQAKGNTAHLRAGLTHVACGDRLIFWARFK